MKSKPFAAALALFAAITATAIALAACAKPAVRSSEWLTRWLNAENAAYTVALIDTDEAGNVLSRTDLRIRGKQYYAKNADGESPVYHALIAEDGKYYKIEGTDEALTKSEISVNEFENDTAIGQILRCKAAIVDYPTFFEEKDDGSYMLKTDQTDFLFEARVPDTKESAQSNDAGGQTYEKTAVLTFQYDTITLTLRDTERAVRRTLVFSKIGTTAFTPYSKRVPTLAEDE